MRLYKLNNLNFYSLEEYYLFNKYKNDWSEISCHQYLPKSFIEKYKDKVD